MQFVQVDASGHPGPLDEEPELDATEFDAPWVQLQERARKLLHVRQ